MSKIGQYSKLKIWRGKNGRIGTKQKEITKNKISKSHKGKVFTDAHKHNLSISHRGEKSYLYKNGITSVYNLIRKSFKMRQWRSDIFMRDNFTCQICGTRKERLNADHIKPFAVIIKENSIKSLEEAEICEELWNINNGRTLCESCHKNTNTFGMTTKYLIK